MMSAGESLKGLVLGQFESYGADFVQIEVKVPTTAKNSISGSMALAGGVEITTLKPEDGEAIDRLPNIREQGAAVSGQAVISYADKNKTVNYFAGSANVPGFFGIKIAAGQIYSAQDDRDLARVIVLGSKVKEELFGNQEAVGQKVKLGRINFQVVGVAKEKGASFGLDFDNLVYLPLNAGQKLMLGIDHVSFISAKMIDTAKQEETAQEIVDLLRERHGIADPKDDDFAVTTAQEAMAMINTVFNGITLLLVAVAGISLLVGGVGIMNIMYVSVTERTAEIGLRKALGARRGQILWQFLSEALVVTIFGGIIGIVLGIFLTFLISFGAKQFGFAWDFILSPQSVIIAFVFCAAVGLIFGYYPARKAAGLDPIAALRHE